MNKQLNFDAPINSLSLGNVSYNFLRELYRAEIDVNLFAVGDRAEMQAYDKKTSDFVEFIKRSGQQRFKKFNRNIPTLKVWHINGSEKKIGDKQYLYTFYELSSPTEEEVNIVNSQEHTFFSSTESCEAFKSAGCKNVSYVPLGFDEDFNKTGKQYFDKDVIHFGLIGKFERRKNTQLIIETWLKKFGNNPKYQLTCLVNNPFFSKEQMQQLISNCMMNKSWGNINFLNSLETNSEVNELINSIDIDLSGCNFNEGWNLPSFNSCCLGNVCIVGLGGAHLDWAEGPNIVHIKPLGKTPCYDNVFFRQGGMFNQGDFDTTSELHLALAFEEAIEVYNNHNKKFDRSDLIQKFSYQNSINKILNVIF